MHFLRLLLIALLFFSCKGIVNKTEAKQNKKINVVKVIPKVKKELFLLNEKNAIPFFYEFGKKNIENKVKIITQYGDIEIELFKNTPYHRANFIYLIKKKYFDGEYFHRVVKEFIIQGGNSDNKSTSKKRRAIGKYLLPPDTRKGYKHDRGVISMPSSEMENPYKLASPYEFFIVQKKDGAYHLDGNYTPFGRVTKGMNVVDIISNLETDKREWPLDNVRFRTEIIE
ncbi:MAG: peptidylprolyl isomerase [Flavobacteriaceae bacterium]|nr:peptidylprolyl isomerase [Flavobacteriaceae bacterium]